MIIKMMAAFALCLLPLASFSNDASRLYVPCVACHSSQAWGSPDGEVPNLGGQRSRYLVRQLMAFRSGSRASVAMQGGTQHSSFANTKQIVLLANYLTELNPNPAPAKGRGDHLPEGQEIYEHICASCHEGLAAGSTMSVAPRISGQHYPYLRRRIEAAAQLHIDLAPPIMAGAMRGMRDADKDAVADFVSRLGP